MIINILNKVLPSILDKVPDAGEKQRLENEIKQLAIQAENEQLKAIHQTNKQEASHRSIFVAGWRPFIGWVCGFGLAYKFVVFPLLSPFLELPSMDIQELSTIITGMLGLGVMRSFEKGKGVDTKDFRVK